jgi:hypothetical protein
VCRHSAAATTAASRSPDWRAARNRARASVPVHLEGVGFAHIVRAVLGFGERAESERNARLAVLGLFEEHLDGGVLLAAFRRGHRLAAPVRSAVEWIRFVDELTAAARPTDRFCSIANDFFEPVLDPAVVAAMVAEVVDLVEPGVACRLRHRDIRHAAFRGSSHARKSGKCQRNG